MEHNIYRAADPIEQNFSHTAEFVNFSQKRISIEQKKLENFFYEAAEFALYSYWTFWGLNICCALNLKLPQLFLS